MAILLANLGTSDLAIKINDFDYCLPIFERNEPNEDTSRLNIGELEVWKDRNSYTEFLYEELNMTLIPSKIAGEKIGVKSSFVDFSQSLLQKYLSNPDIWHHRIRPGRIGGVIIDAQKKFELQKIHLFVTNQSPQHHLDTVYLFEILKYWFKREYDSTLIANEIPFGVTAKESDKLLSFYYDFFTENINSNSIVLVSIKGGTPQMQTALKMQAIASSVSRLMFIDPQFDISKILAGEFSDCELTSYWRYIRTQKYQTVKLLLEENHWDFNGSTQILRDWQTVLKFFISHHIVETNDIASSSQVISKIIKTLDIGINCFNLDIKYAQTFLQNNPQLKLSSRLASEVNNYDVTLNLYTQCRIYWKLNQIANFLSRMSSFYEAVLDKLANNLNCYSGYSRFDNRFDKRNFIDSQMKSNNTHQKIQDWEKILTLLKNLDFWCKQRNSITHDGKGVSKQRMEELFNQESKYNSEICHPNLIIRNMEAILSNNLELVRNEYKHKYVAENQEYYIYSEVKNWVIQTLDTHSLS